MLLWIIFQYIAKQATLFARRNDFMHCSLQIKQNIYSVGIFVFPVMAQFIVKVYRKIDKSPIFEKKVSEYDQEIPQSQTLDNPVAPRKFTISLLVNLFWM